MYFNVGFVQYGSAEAVINNEPNALEESSPITSNVELLNSTTPTSTRVLPLQPPGIAVLCQQALSLFMLTPSHMVESSFAPALTWWNSTQPRPAPWLSLEPVPTPSAHPQAPAVWHVYVGGYACTFAFRFRFRFRSHCCDAPLQFHRSRSRSWRSCRC